MATKIESRKFGKTVIAIAIAVFVMGISCDSGKKEPNQVPSGTVLKNKIALNAYSFNAPLRDGSMDLFDMMNYCSGLGIDGVDLTGYYFPGYPAAPSDEYIYSIKRKAFELGLHICGTGVRNDFCLADEELRSKEIEHVKDWIVVAHKLGAPAIRIFPGQDVPEGFTWNETAKWVAEAILECAEFGKKHGVVIEIQNHNHFLKTADDVIRFMEMIDSEWVGLMLDIGSYRTTSDPYSEIEQTAGYAVSWQIKEDVYMENTKTPVDLKKIKEIIAKSEFKGYIPIETMGEGDPYEKVENHYRAVMDTFR